MIGCLHGDLLHSSYLQCNGHTLQGASLLIGTHSAKPLWSSLWWLLPVPMGRPMLPLGFKRTAPKLALGNMELHPLRGRSKEKLIDQPVKPNKNSPYFTSLSLLSWDFRMNRREQAPLEACIHEGPQDVFFAAFLYVPWAHKWPQPWYYMCFQKAHTGGLCLLYVSKRFLCDFEDVALYLSKTEMCTCPVVLEIFISDLSMRPGRWAKSISGEDHTQV